MAGTSDPVIVALTGQLPFVVIAAAVIALPVSLLLLRLYRRAVLKSMRARGGGAATAAHRAGATYGALPAELQSAELKIDILDARSAPAAPSAAAALHVMALHAQWRAVAVYLAAGGSFGLVMTAAFLTATEAGFLPFRTLMLFWTYAAWPAVITVNLVAAFSLRARLQTVALYFIVLTILTAIAVARSPALSWGQIAYFWISTNAPPTLLMMAFLSRPVRAVGPLVVTFLVVALAGVATLLAIAANNPGWQAAMVQIGGALGLGGVGTFVVFNVAGLTLFGLAAWPIVGWLRKGYRAKKISDQSITVDAMWLLFGVDQSIGLVFEGPLWILSGVVAFAAYKLTAQFGFKLARGVPHRPVLTLLLLRVFALGKRSQRLFDVVANRWRFLGRILLIAGPDLATTTIEPHEFLSFLSGKTSRLFVASQAAIDRKLAEADPDPDFDGRHRVDEFFCHDDTWRSALVTLVKHSDVVMMDLRGFTPANAGCVFELNELLNSTPLARIILVVDTTTDLEFLERTVQAAWSRLRADSPNRNADSPRLAAFRLTAGVVDAEALLVWLCAAAGRAGA